jgi:hypothetical protein
MTTRIILSSKRVIKTLEYASSFFVYVKSGAGNSEVVHGPYDKDDKRFSTVINNSTF